jgi:hypothetical protein
LDRGTKPNINDGALPNLPKFGLLVQALFKVRFRGSILKKTEQGDIHKYSIYNLQSSIPARPDLLPAKPPIFGYRSLSS